MAKRGSDDDVPVEPEGENDEEASDDLQDGDAALSGVAVAVFKALVADSRFAGLVSGADLQELAHPIRDILATFFDGSVWPLMRVSIAVAPATLDPFFDVVLDVASKEPVPLGEDILVHAFKVIVRDHLSDGRVTALREHVESCAVIEPFSEDSTLRKAAHNGHGSGEALSTGEGESEEEEDQESRSSASEDQRKAEDGEEDEEDDDDEEEEGTVTGGTRTKLPGTSLETLEMSPDQAAAIEMTWKSFLDNAESRQSAGEALMAAFMDGIPGVAPLFKTPPSIQGQRFISAIESMVENLSDEKKLKELVEELGFSHLQLEVTLDRVLGFRNAFCDLLALELSEAFTTEAADGWRLLLEYVGSSMIYVRTTYSERVDTILESWRSVSPGDAKDASHHSSMEKKHQGSATDVEVPVPEKSQSHHRTAATQAQQQQQQKAPTTFVEMFRFNAAVMGYSSRRWMVEVLRCFDSIVTNIANAHRIHEECDCLALRIARITKKTHVKLGEFKSVMLASLRSLLPKEWSTRHETAWTWLWSNVERLLLQTMGKPRVWEAALMKAISALSEELKFDLRKDIYGIFFINAPAGQDHFKQSNTFLHFIAETVIELTLDIFRQPVAKVDDLSAIGLRHVGYAVPTALFAPFVSACIEAISKYVSNVTALEAFKWSINLVAKIITRTIDEGSTAVMKAINLNSASEVRKAAACAPRGLRASWMLRVEAGNQSISPLQWALSTGRAVAAGAMIEDLLTIRADRDRYYFGGGDLFHRHPDVLKLLCDEAPTLIPLLLERLVWRSHMTEGGCRRVHYFVKYLLVDNHDEPADTFRWLAHLKDPDLACHPIVSMLSDILWRRVALKQFFLSKFFVLISLVVFVIGQAVLPHFDVRDYGWKYDAIFACRASIYVLGIPNLFFTTVARAVRFYKRGDIVKVKCIRLPAFVQEWQEVCKILLCISLVMMLSCEPILHCWSSSGSGDKLFWTGCDDGERISTVYLTFVSASLVLYFLLVLELCILSNKVSAYMLVVKHVWSEFGLFLLGLIILTAAFACALSVFKQKDLPEYGKLWTAFEELILEGQQMVDEDRFEVLARQPVVAGSVVVFLLFACLFFGNLLVAQLTCSYDEIFKYMVGYARLGQMRIVMEILPRLKKKKWHAFLASLNLDRPLEFSTGDVGLAGGVEVFEPANLHPTTTNSIHRYAGSTDPNEPWPTAQEDLGISTHLHHMAKIEKFLRKILLRLVHEGKANRSAMDSFSGSVLSNSKVSSSNASSISDG